MNKLFEKHETLFCMLLIAVYILVNSLSVFNVENTLSIYIAPVFLTVVPLAYAVYIHKKIPQSANM